MVKIYLAVSSDSGVFKHWGIFLDESQESDKIVLQVRGSDGRFRYEPESGNARRLVGLEELVYLFDVEDSKTGIVRAIARELPVRSEVHGWNCQDWVLDFLEKLEEEGIVSKTDMGYEGRKDYVRGKLEGLV
ncbi:hypothetical protein ETB97_012418 [Aspergillus alliaceus]|uniref:Uncharacterized protein n=1 Tax=Petromyces alliaceus TaxID=209559 RepID=A0A8H6A6Y6_PETAA|nr:hypothetical protein ETB97_012418 [Aspergillus burnettii]